MNQIKQPSTKSIWLGMLLVGIFMFSFGYNFAVDGYRFTLSSRGLQWYKVSIPTSTSELDLSRFWRVLTLVEDNFLRADSISKEQLVDGAIKGMVDALDDPYTYYLTNEQTTNFQEGLDGTYEGIGVQLGYKDDVMVIIAPLAGGPAAAADVQTGDLLLAVDGEPTNGLNLGEVVQRVRGEQGTEVQLSLGRRNEAGEVQILEVTLTRAQINAPNMILTWEDDQIAYVNVLRFGTGIEGEWQELEQELLQQNAQGVIIDVRNNPGGYLNGAVTIASSFTEKGLIVAEKFASGEEERFSAPRDGALRDMQVVVLINDSSASASEILAGALQQRAAARLVGVKTFGKNTVQQAYNLDSGRSVHITAAHWVLPNGDIIPDDGIMPDIEIADTEENGVDEQKERALEEIKKLF